MPNKNYIKGRRKEYRFIREAKAQGFLSFRSAGSHSPIDVVVIDKRAKVIKFIQCKPESMSQNAKEEIENSQKELNDFYTVRFQVR